MSKWDIPDNINFAYYESPLQQIIGEVVETRIKQEENAAMAHITETIGYKVDKTELIKALNYDRDQYAKGYADGLNADRWISVEDQLPEEGEEVLITILWKDGIRTIEKSALCDCTLWKGFGRDINVIAWMPLPPCYDPQESEVTDADSD